GRGTNGATGCCAREAIGDGPRMSRNYGHARTRNGGPGSHVHVERSSRRKADLSRKTRRRTCARAEQSRVRSGAEREDVTRESRSFRDGSTEARSRPTV